MPQDEDQTAQAILERLSSLENHPEEVVPYREFIMWKASSTTSLPMGSSTAGNRESRRGGGFFCGYLSGEAWRHRAGDH